jgi:hypothetical protein
MVTRNTQKNSGNRAQKVSIRRQHRRAVGRFRSNKDYEDRFRLCNLVRPCPIAATFVSEPARAFTGAAVRMSDNTLSIHGASVAQT